MALTPAQKTALKAHIDSSNDLNIYPNTNDGNEVITGLLNAPSSPAFIAWKSSVEAVEIMANGFTWTEVDALTGGKARIWDWMTRYGSFNPSKANVRQGLRDCFGVNSGTYTGMLPHLKRTATRAEKLFATGTGTDQTPGQFTFEGELSRVDVEEARNF